MKKIIFAVFMLFCACKKTNEKAGILMVVNHSYTTIVADVSVNGVSEYKDIGRSKTAFSVPASGTVKITLVKASTGNIIYFVDSQGDQASEIINTSNFSMSHYMILKDGGQLATITIPE